MNKKLVLSATVIASYALSMYPALTNKADALADVDMMQSAFINNNPTSVVLKKVTTPAELRTALSQRLNYVSEGRRKDVITYIKELSHGDRDIAKALNVLDEQYYALLEALNNITPALTTRDQFYQKVTNKFTPILVTLNAAKDKLDKAWMTTYADSKKTARDILDALYLAIIKAVNETRFVAFEKRGLFAQVSELPAYDPGIIPSYDNPEYVNTDPNALPHYQEMVPAGQAA